LRWVVKVASRNRTASAGQPPSGSQPAPATRLAWLDALRGIAVLAVVFEHVSYFVLPGARGAVMRVVHPGTFGVMLFFLVSGYIIPASLERGGARRFWLGRLFRLYPLWAVVGVAALAAGAIGLAPAPDAPRASPVAAVLANVTMLPGLLGVAPPVNVMWTLTYEMCFYLLSAALLAVGAHRFSAELAVGSGAVAVLAGALLPAAALSGAIGAGALTLVAVPLLTVGVAGTLLGRGRGAPAVAGAALLGVVLVALLAVNQRPAGWEGFATLAVMFAGTAVYRAQHGEIGWRRAALAAGVTFGCLTVAAGAYGGVWFLDDLPAARAARIWVTATLLAALTFAAAMAARHRRMPRALIWVGLVSYSVYLLHQGVALVFEPWLVRAGRDAGWVRGLAVTGYLAAVLLCSGLAYHLIERPAQRWGRRLAGRPAAAVLGGREAGRSAGGDRIGHPLPPAPVHVLGRGQPASADRDLAQRAHQAAGEHD
jgi:peptidoglycan/LPS O-acetylase OafA/YrhL